MKNMKKYMTYINLYNNTCYVAYDDKIWPQDPQVLIIDDKTGLTEFIRGHWPSEKAILNGSTSITEKEYLTALTGVPII